MRRMPRRTVEIDGPEGRFVIRAQPHGVPYWATMRAGPWWGYLRRPARRDHAWDVTVRARAHDPFGPPLVALQVPSRWRVNEAVADLEARVRAGELHRR